jgi:hypothetical protein
MPAETIDEVIAELDGIIAWCQERGSRLGYFPALYRTVTIRVKEDIARGRFEDGERMERLDVVFANRYIEAFHQYRRGEQPTRAWAYSFRMADKPHGIILQHLLLGMNAHINLDLGVAAAQVAPGATLPALKRDFDEINNLLAETVGHVQAQLSECSPLMVLIIKHGGELDEAVSHFSLRKARRLAWWRAGRLATLNGSAFDGWVRRFDRRVYIYARVICPEYLVNPVLRAIRAVEIPDVRQIIGHLL